MQRLRDTDILCFVPYLDSLKCIYLCSLWSQFVSIICSRKSELTTPIASLCLEPEASVAMQDVFLHSVQYLLCSLNTLCAGEMTGLLEYLASALV